MASSSQSPTLVSFGLRDMSREKSIGMQFNFVDILNLLYSTQLLNSTGIRVDVEENSCLSRLKAC